MNDDQEPSWFKEQKLELDFLYNQLLVSSPDYKDATNRLVKVALSEGKGASAAAQVLLSCQDEKNWQLNVNDLSSLAHVYLLDALVVIRGFLILRKRPSELIENGEKKLKLLSDNWKDLHTERRYSSFYNKTNDVK